jgi:hypothetical protein
MARCVLADHEYDPSQALADDYFESSVAASDDGTEPPAEESATAQADGGDAQ